MTILLTSSANVLLRERLAELVAAFRAKAGVNATVIRRSVDRETRFSDLRRELGSTSLFATKQLVVLRGAVADLPAAEQAALLEYLKSGALPDTTTLVLAELEPLPPATKSKLLAYLKKSTTIKKLSAAAPSARAASADLTVRAKQLGATLSPAVAQQLAARAGTDYDRLVNELTKLALFAAARPGKTITAADVAETIEASVESDIFATIGALGRRQLREALTLLHRHLRQGAHPLYLLSMVRYQVRSLVAVQAANGDARLAGVSPFVARKAQAELCNFAGRDLRGIFSKLVDADEAIKTSRVDGDVALDLLAVAICG
ncbi:MAG: DNA polymerase III subunit delta [Candidatus Andersenbacteria bacterium]